MSCKTGNFDQSRPTKLVAWIAVLARYHWMETEYDLFLLWTVFASLANRVAMNDRQPKKPGKDAQTREDRLKAALKANMAKRKAQARARAVDNNKNQKE